MGLHWLFLATGTWPESIGCTTDINGKGWARYCDLLQVGHALLFGENESYSKGTMAHNIPQPENNYRNVQQFFFIKALSKNEKKNKKHLNYSYWFSSCKYGFRDSGWVDLKVFLQSCKANVEVNGTGCYQRQNKKKFDFIQHYCVMILPSAD